MAGRLLYIPREVIPGESLGLRMVSMISLISSMKKHLREKEFSSKDERKRRTLVCPATTDPLGKFNCSFAIDEGLPDLPAHVENSEASAWDVEYT